ncbi:MAG: FAD-dependent monooxygenase [Jiangellaceae bacterium]
MNSRRPSSPHYGSRSTKDRRDATVVCVVVGAGPAGLAASQALGCRGVEYLVLQRQGREFVADAAVGWQRRCADVKPGRPPRPRCSAPQPHL